MYVTQNVNAGANELSFQKSLSESDWLQALDILYTFLFINIKLFNESEK